MSKRTFREHGVTAMIVNVVGAILPLLFLWVFEHATSTFHPIPTMAFIFCFIMYYPHPTYLFFELKHLLMKDGIADERDPLAVFVFGGLSLLGFVLQVYTILKVYGLVESLQNYGVISILLLSFIAAVGGCLGLTDLLTLHGLLNPTLIPKHLLKVAKNKALIVVCVLTTIMLTGTASLFIR